MGRQINAPQNQAVGMRCGSSTQFKYVSTFSHMVGGTVLYTEFSGGVSVSILDNRIDWRDRILTVSGQINISASDHLPDSSPGLIRPDPANGRFIYLGGEIFCTGLGWDANIANAPTKTRAYCQFRNAVGTTLSVSCFLYADSTDGFLKMYSISPVVSGLMMIVATEQTGKLVTIP